MTTPAPSTGQPATAGSSPPPVQSCDWCLMAFLSSSLGELAEERATLDQVLQTTDLPLRVWRYEEDAGAASVSHQEVWRDNIARSDLYIGVFANKLGRYTLDEYDHAREHGKPMLLFAKDLVEEDRLPELQAFLAKADDPESGLAFGLFSTPDDFAVKVQRSLRNEFARRFRQSAKIGDRPKATSDAGVAVTPTEHGWEASRVAPDARPQTVPIPSTRARHATPPAQAPVAQRSALARVRDLVCQGQPLLDVLGDPGSGKSGLIRRLTDAAFQFACPAGDTVEFPDGQGIAPQVAAGDGFADVVQAVWEQFHRHGDEAGGPGVERALADLDGTRALLVFPDSHVAPDVLRDLAARLPGSVIVAEPRRGAAGAAVVVEAPAGEPEWREILRNELAIVAEPLPGEVTGFLKDLDGNPALIAQLANRFKDHLAQQPGGTLADLAGQYLGVPAKSWLIPPRYRRVARLAADIEVPAPREVFVSWLADELGSEAAAAKVVDGAVESGILVPGSPRLTLAPGLRPLVSEEPALETLDHHLAAAGLEGESVAGKLETLANGLGDADPGLLDRVAVELESAVDALLGADLPVIDALQEAVHALRSGRGVAGALRGAAGSLLGAAHDDSELRKLILESAVDWVKQASLDDLFYDRGFAHEMLRWAAEFRQWDDVVAIGRPLEAALALTGRSDAWAGTISSVLRAARHAGDLSTEAWALHQRGTKALYDADHDAARRDLRDALKLRRRLGERRAARLTRRNLGLVPTAIKTPKRTLAWLGAAVAAMLLVLGAGEGGEATETVPPIDPVPPNTIEVLKTADANGDGEFGHPVLDATVPAGVTTEVVFQVEVRAPAGEPVEITGLTDTGPDGAATDLAGSSCAGAAGADLEPGGPAYTCTFVATIGGEEGGVHENEVSVTADGTVVPGYSGTGRVAIGYGPPTPAGGPPPAAEPAVEVIGTIAPREAPEGAARARPVSVVAVLDAAAWPATVVAVHDDGLGGLEDVPGSTCGVPVEVARNAAYRCRYPVRVGGNAGDTVTRVVTVTAVEADGRLISGQDTVPVTFVDVAPRLDAELRTEGAALAGGTAQVVLTIRNDSEATDPVTLAPVQDGDRVPIPECGALAVVAPGAAVECTFGVAVPAEPGGTLPVRVEVVGEDDEVTPVTAAASVDIPILASGVTVEVDATPDSEVAFPFAAPIGGAASEGAPRTVGLTPGAHTITEGEVPAGWRLTGVRCDDGLPDRISGPVDVTVPVDGTVTCTFSYESDDEPPPDGDTVKVDVTPEVLLWPDPDDPEAPAQRTVTVRNTGNLPFDVSLSMDPPGAPFVVDAGDPACNGELQPDDVCRLLVEFTGAGPAPANLTVTVTGAGRTEGDQVVLLYGE